MIEPAFFLRGRNWKEQKLRNPVFQISLNLPQDGWDVVTKVTTQTRNWLRLIQALDYEKRLNQLAAIEFSFRA